MLIAANGTGGHDLSAAPRQRVFVAFIQSADSVAVEALLVDFEKGADQEIRRKLFYREADGLRGVRESSVSQRSVCWSPPSRAEQLSRGIIVKLGHRMGDLKS